MLRIYKSSAGSGKTYTLVKEYIRIALQEPDKKYKHILALTFTNKAANEMKERIISSLKALADNTAKPELVKDLIAEAKLNSEELAEKSAIILRHILHDYSSLSVGTIDSFVHRIIRAFAYDLQLPMNFDIEMDGLKLLTETIELLMDRLSEEDDQVTTAIVEFAESNIDEGKGWNLEHSLIQLAGELFDEDAYPHLEKLEDFEIGKGKKVRENLYQYVNGFEQQLFAIGKKAFQLIMRSGLTSQSFFQSTKGIYGYFSKYANGEFPNDLLGNSYVLKSINEDKWAGGKASEIEKAGIEGIKSQLTKYYNDIAIYYSNEGKDYVLAKLLLRNFYSFILLADIQKLMNEYKRDNNLVHISEFQKKIHAIVKEQDAPVIYERIGEWYQDILIDEHQDTSELQWQNLLPLVENAQTNLGSSLVVGDGKQSIYRFRRAKVEQFDALPAIYGSEKNIRLKEREIAINNYGVESINLASNWRSRNDIIDFNNGLYDVLSQLPDLKAASVYKGQMQEKGRNMLGGYVQIDFLKDGDLDNLDEQRCVQVESLVKGVLNKGYALKDVAVLTRSNKSGTIIASYLIEKGIRVISSESLLINNSPKVRLILSALNYLDKRDNHIIRAEIFYYVHLLLLKKDFRFEQFNFKTNEEIFEKDISGLIGKEFHSYNFLSCTLVDLIHNLISFFNLNDDDPFLQFFVDETLAFASRNRTNIREFLDWWEEVKFQRSIIYPDTLDAVKIMTIHKSKGLEFPIVIMADADWPQSRAKRNFWVQLDKPWLKDLHTGILPVSKDVLETDFAGLYVEEEASSFLDMLNLLYVATTRAEDMLYILSTEPAREPEKNNTITALLINYLKQQGVWMGFQTYTFGDAKTAKVSKEKKEGKLVYEKQKIEIADKRTHQVTIRKNSKLLWNEEKVEKIDWGNLLHEALKRITYTGDAGKVIEKLLNEGLIDATQKMKMQQQVTAVIGNADLKTYFNQPYKVINERALLINGDVRIPDRVVVDKDKAIIIDYKTGEQKAEHRLQLNNYASELMKFGFTEVKKFLVYSENNIVEEV